MKLLGYTRVSTEEQAYSGLGLEAQLHSLVQAAVSRPDWELVDTYEDAGVSGSIPWEDRPGLSAAVSLLNAGQANGLVVAKLDRLSRSMLDFVQLASEAEEHGWAIVALDLGVDTTTPMGRFMLNILGAFAAFERDMIRARTRDALQAKKRNGHKLGRPYAIPDHIRARIIREHHEGRGLVAIARGLEQDLVPTSQGRPWTHQTIARVLQSAPEE